MDPPLGAWQLSHSRSLKSERLRSRAVPFAEMEPNEILAAVVKGARAHRPLEFLCFQLSVLFAVE